MTGRLLPSGERALLAEVDTLEEVLELNRRLWVDDRAPGLVDAVTGARTLLLVVDSAGALGRVRSAAETAIRTLSGSSGTAVAEAGDAADVEIAVHYHGPDLADVAELTGLSPEEVVAAHTGRVWRVGFSGFAPGFAYLVGGDPRLDVPRRASPRTRVPAGAVGLAGEFSGIYPRSSPGGWQLIGRTEQVLWDLDRDPPALLRPGLRVQFVDADRVDVHRVDVDSVDGDRADGDRVDGDRVDVVGVDTDGTAMTGDRAATAGQTAYARLEVLATGPLALVQDRGRPGLSELGVGPSGAADRGAHALGARLLGQDTDRAAIEAHHGGLALRAHGAVTVVLTGAPTTATVDGSRVGHAAPFTVGDGAVLDLGRPTSGLRTYLSVRGGIDVEPVLGSRSYDTLSAIGPAPLRQGDLLRVGSPVGQPTVDVAPVPTPSSGTVVLDLLPGPRRDWLRDVAELTSSPWTIDPASDRVGLRLDGAVLTRSPQFEDRELPSEGVVRGAVQVTADGRPVVFLADHPVTGGYPVVAVVTERAADLAAQLVPGQQVRLRMASSRP